MLGCASTIARWSARGARVVDTGEHDVGLRRRVQRTLGEDHEEVRFEPPPVHLARAREACRHRHALHVPGQRVTKHHLKFLGDFPLEGEFESVSAAARPAPFAAVSAPNHLPVSNVSVGTIVSR